MIKKNTKKISKKSSSKKTLIFASQRVRKVLRANGWVHLKAWKILNKLINMHFILLKFWIWFYPTRKIFCDLGPKMPDFSFWNDPYKNFKYSQIHIYQFTHKLPSFQMHPTICSESVLNSLSCKNECFFRRRLFWYFFGLFFHRALNSTAKKSYPSNISASSDPSPEEQNLMLEGRRRCFIVKFENFLIWFKLFLNESQIL